MRHLLIVSDFYAPHWTGLSKSIEGLAHRLADKQTHVDILTVRHTPHLAPHEESADISIYRAPPLIRISRTNYSLALLGWAILRIRRCDTVLINSPCSNVLPIALLAKLLGRRVVLFHQGDLILPPHNALNRIVEWIFDIATHVGCLLADGLATYSQDYAQHSRILHRYHHKTSTFILPQPILPTNHEAAQKHDQPPWVAQMELLKSQGVVVFGCAGRFVHEKGLDVLFDALLQLKKQKKDTHIHILYAGAAMTYESYMDPYQDILAKLHATITFTGLLHAHDLKQFYEVIDAFILPSRSDCFGLVQAEALAAGKPLVVSDIPGARILVKDFGCGILFQSESPQDLARAMLAMSTSPTRYQAEIAAARSFLNSPDHLKRAKMAFFPNR